MLVQLLVGGLVMGSIYALIALGFVLVYRTLGVVNFAHGELLMVAAFVATSLTGVVGPHPLLQAIVTVAVMTVLGGLIYAGILRFMVRQSMMSVVILTAVLGLALRELSRILFGSLPRTLPPLFGNIPLHIGGASILPQHLVILGTTVLLVSLLYVLLQKTRVGTIMRAVATDFDMARMTGIRVHDVGLMVTALGAALAAIAGFLLVPIFLAETEMGVPLLLKVFAAVVIGGFGSIPGAVVGGLSVGLIEIFAAAYISSAYKDAYAFAAMILILALRPQGIFGDELSNKF